MFSNQLITIYFVHNSGRFSHLLEIFVVVELCWSNGNKTKGSLSPIY
jgi:hypothetical protein